MELLRHRLCLYSWLLYKIEIGSPARSVESYEGLLRRRADLDVSVPPAITALHPLSPVPLESPVRTIILAKSRASESN